MATGFLDDCELADLAADLASVLDTPITATRPRSGQIADGWGHRKANGPAVQVAACNALFLRPSGPVLAQIQGKVGALVVWVMSVPLGTDLQTEDVVTVTATGLTYTVHAVLSPESYSPWLNVIVAAVQ